MPHLILESSANLHESNERLRQILVSCQGIVVNGLPTQLSSCKSRLVMCDVFVLGDDSNKNKAFLHLTVKVLKKPERTVELLKNISIQLKENILNNCTRSLAEQEVNVSVEIVELHGSYVQ